MQLIDVLNGNQKCTVTVQEMFDFLEDELERNREFYEEKDEFGNNALYKRGIQTLTSWLPNITDIYVYGEQAHYNKPVIGGTRDPHIEIQLSNGEMVSRVCTNLEEDFCRLIEKIHENSKDSHEVDR